MADLREGPRRVDVTVGIHLDSDDTDSEVENVIGALQEHLAGSSFTVNREGATPFVIDSVDDPIHVHSVVLSVDA